MERDPENRMLARGPSSRLTAEMIRDNALVASELINREIGGKVCILISQRVYGK